MTFEPKASRNARVVLWPVVSVAAAALVWALPVTVAFASHAPYSFWAIAIGALLVDAPIFGRIRHADTRIRPIFSICFALTVFLLWGTAPAIVVQATAAMVTVVGQRYRPEAGILLVSRLVCGAAVAGIAVAPLRPFNDSGDGLVWREVAEVLLAAGVWLAVVYGLLALAREAVVPGGLRQSAAEMRTDLFRTATSLLLVPPVLATVGDWWPLLVAVPVVAWHGLQRERLHHEDDLRREPETGLLNRRGLIVGMRTLASRDATTMGPRPLAVIVVSVDSASIIVNTLGRDIAETVMRSAAQRLVDAYGEDHVGQLSGETFVVLLPDVGAERAQAVAEAAVRRLLPPIEANEIPFLLDAVAGVALSPEHGGELNTLLLKAGLAASMARRHGQYAALYVRQAAAVTRRRAELLRDLRLTLADPSRHRELTVVYQPQVDMRNGHLVGVEALLRWAHPTLGPVPTGEAIEAVESSQVMRLLTRHVLEIVAAQLSRWNAEGRSVRAAVNVSVQDLHDPAFPAELHGVVATHGISANQIMIEITERILMTDLPRIAYAARALIDLGVGLSLDDFGTGHASLQQLRQLPLTEVKIDRAYVGAIVESPADLAIVTSVYQLGEAMGSDVVAEGVEDERTAQTLRSLGGVIGQGYYFGKPMSADALRQWAPPPVLDGFVAPSVRRASPSRPSAV